MVLNKYIFMRFTLFCHTTANDTYMCLCDHNHKTANDTYMCLCDHNHKTQTTLTCVYVTIIIKQLSKPNVANACCMCIMKKEKNFHLLHFSLFAILIIFKDIWRYKNISIKISLEDTCSTYKIYKKIYNATILNAPLITNTMLV
jgi:hypothetical protein